MKTSPISMSDLAQLESQFILTRIPKRGKC